jgi:hypothetical protein
MRFDRTQGTRNAGITQSLTLLVATNRLEAAQERWIQEHAGRLRALVRLHDRSGLEIVTSTNEQHFLTSGITRARLSSDTLGL